MVLKNILDSVDSERITIIYRNIGYDKFTVGLFKYFTDDFLNSEVCSMAASIDEDGKPTLNIWINRDN